MNKIIIENRTNMSMSKALEHVKIVIQSGRISDDGKQYCYVTTWPDGVAVIASKNKKSDRFVLIKK